MNMFARFDENPAMTLQEIKETKRYGRTDNVKTVYPPQTKFAGGIMKISFFFLDRNICGYTTTYVYICAEIRKISMTMENLQIHVITCELALLHC